MNSGIFNLDYFAEVIKIKLFAYCKKIIYLETVEMIDLASTWAHKLQ